MTEFVTIQKFNFLYETIVLKSILESRGIKYFFQNENLIAIDPLASFAYGGIVLKIHPNDLAEVQIILDRLNSTLELLE